MAAQPIYLQPDTSVVKRKHAGRGSKLQEQHLRFILRLKAEGIDSPTEIARRLKSKKWAGKVGFEPVEVGSASVGHVLKNLDPRALSQARNEYLADFSGTPLAFKRHRLEELTTHYKTIDGLTIKRRRGSEWVDEPMPAVRVLTLKLAVLKQIKEEMGEDMEKLAAAIRDSRPETLNISFTKSLTVEVLSVLAEEAGLTLVPKEANASVC